MIKYIVRGFAIVMFIVLLSHDCQATNGEWNTTTSFDGEKSEAILSWSFNTTEEVTSFTIKKGEEVIEPSLLTSTATSSYKYQVINTQSTRGIKITLTVYDITTLDSDVYRCSLDLLDVHKDIHLNIADLMPTSNPVISTLHQNAKLVWEYNNHRYPASKLIVSRQNKKIGEWISNGGFVPEDDRFRRNLIFDKTTIKEVPVWIDPIRIVTAGLGEDVIFTWQYKYSIQPRIIYVRQRNEASARMSESISSLQDTNKWHIYPKYTSLASMKNTFTEKGGIIQLVLLYTKKDLFGHNYECDITFQDGKSIAWEIRLMDDTYLTTITTYFTNTDLTTITTDVTDTDHTTITTDVTDTDLTTITTDVTDTDLTTITTDVTDTDLTTITTDHHVVVKTNSNAEKYKSLWIHSNYHVILIPLSMLFLVLIFYLITRLVTKWRKYAHTYYQQLNGYVPNIENSYTAIRPPSTASSIDTHIYESCEQNVSSNVDNGNVILTRCASVSLDYEYPIENQIRVEINRRRATILHSHSASDIDAHRDISFIDDNESLRCSSVSHEYEYPAENQSQRYSGRCENRDSSFKMDNSKCSIISSHEPDIQLDKHVETGSSGSISSSEIFECPPSKQYETEKTSESMVTHYDTNLTSSHQQESEL